MQGEKGGEERRAGHSEERLRQGRRDEEDWNGKKSRGGRRTGNEKSENNG